MDLRLGEASDSLEKSVRVRDSTGTKDDDLKGVSSFSGSKRSRVQNGLLNLICSVDGCNADLSDCREYHKRHRVCEKHSKTPVVLVGGKQQRFCQQCSRYINSSCLFRIRSLFNFVEVNFQISPWNCVHRSVLTYILQFCSVADAQKLPILTISMINLPIHSFCSLVYTVNLYRSSDVLWTCRSDVGFIRLRSLMRLRGVAGNGLMGIIGGGGSLKRLLFSWLLRNSCTITKVCVCGIPMILR